MFRMSFNRNVLKTSEEQPFAWVYAYVAIGLRMQLVLIRM